MENIDFDISEMGDKDVRLTPEEAKEFCERWERIHQYPRRLIDQQEALEDQNFRYLTRAEQDKADAIDPCPECICTRFMEPGYCTRPCRAKVRNIAYKTRNKNL